MNPGTSETSTNETTLVTSKSLTPKEITDHFGQDIRDFISQIAVCKSQGMEELESSNEIIKYYNRGGLGDAKYFIFEGIKVYPLGQMETIKKEAEEQMSVRLHGHKEGRVVGG